MRAAVPREREGQPLVVATSQTIELFIRLEYEILVGCGAGLRASFPGSLCENAGANLADVHNVWASDVVIAVDTPNEGQLAAMRPDTTLVTRLASQQVLGLAESLAPLGITALAMDAAPRISRTQVMDVPSSRTDIAGYRTIVEAANHFGRVFTDQVTTAGKALPARIYITGTGVAGLAAIGTANSMGAFISATGVRPGVAEQVGSMGANFVPLPISQGKSEGRYAKALSAEEAATADALYAKQTTKSDIVITTANIPGRTVPALFGEDAIAGMAPGSIIVDMAAVSDGSCAFTVPEEVTTTANSVTIIGYVGLVGHLPTQASSLYGRNIMNLLEPMTPGRGGEPVVDPDDEIVRGVTVSVENSIIWPPPPIRVSAALAKVASGPSKQELAEEAARRTTKEKRTKRTGLIGLVLTIAVFITLILAAPAAAAGHYIVLILAMILSFYVISNVTPALYIPLMSVTNAISGIILVDVISQIGDPHPLIAGTSFAAIILVSVNIFSGFAVTHRMLATFRK